MPERIKQTIRCFVLGFQIRILRDLITLQYSPSSYADWCDVPVLHWVFESGYGSPRKTGHSAAVCLWRSFFLYFLNLLVLATFLPQDQLRVVPILTVVFVGGRLVYWLCLHMCSPWRGFGSGLAMVAFNLYCLYDLSLRQLLFGSGDTLCNQTTPSSWPLEMSQSPSGKSDSVIPIDILETQ